jgi:plastocyanin
MDNETLFYVCGIVLAVSAVVVTFLGLKSEKFPGKAMPVVILWFAIFVLGATTFAVKYSGEEQEARAAELEKAGEEIEQAEGSGGFSNEGGALGGETEEGEEEAEKAAPGEEEPVGPTTGSKEGNEGAGKGGVTEGEKGSQTSSTTLELAADESALAFDRTELSAKPGKVTIDFSNPSPIPHNVVILKDGKELAGFDPITEGEEEVSAELEAGSYEFICSVPGHAQAGMKGTLTVK